MTHETPPKTELADPRWAGRIFIVSGPSGVGKSLLVRRLLESEPSLARVITATTRPPGARERDGVDYHFVSDDQFSSWIEQGLLLEHVEFCGRRYGTPVSSVLGPLNAGKKVVLVIEVCGALKVKAMAPNAASIFIAPPNLQELRRRLALRGRETQEALERRLRRALEELQLKDRYDYIVVNDRVEDAVEDLRRIILAAQ